MVSTSFVAILLVASNLMAGRAFNDFSEVMTTTGYSMLDLTIMMAALMVPAWTNILGMLMLRRNHK